MAWTYASGGADTVGNRSQMQCNPLITNGVLYGVSAGTQVFALETATGEERWKTKLTDTGKRLWHFQFVHHDIWDRDPPAPPNLLTVLHGGKRVDAVAQITKQSHVFVFDRVTGKPLFPVVEQAFSSDGVAGEQTSPTQPIPLKPAPFTKQTFTEGDINPWVADRQSVVATLRKARTGSPYIPITSEMTAFFPGTDGGSQWGGAATDPEGTIYIPAKQNPCFSTSVERKQRPAKSSVTESQLIRPALRVLPRTGPAGQPRRILPVADGHRQTAFDGCHSSDAAEGTRHDAFLFAPARSRAQSHR